MLESLALLEALHSTASKDLSDERAVSMLLQFCQVILANGPGWRNSDYRKCIDRVACIALELKELDLFKRCVDMADGYLSISVGESIGTALWSIGFPVLRLQ
jgi:hypothetical protein